MKKTLTVLLIEDSSDYAALVQQWLSLRTDIAFVLNWADSLQAGLKRLKRGGVDVILLDLGLPDSKGLETFTRTKFQAAGVPVILLSEDNGEQLALQMVHEGAEDYIVKASCNGDSLAKAIQYAVVRAGSRAESVGAESAPDQAAVIGVMGVKGGVGGTTIACNLAVELRRQTDKKTLLVDLDLASGMVGFLMGAESKYSVLDAVLNVDRMDVTFWEGLVAQCSGNLDVLRSPGLPSVAEPEVANLQQVLAMIRKLKLYDWVVVDLGRPAGLSLGLVNNLTELLLVTTTSVPALYEAKRTVETLRRAGFQQDRLRLIVNQLFGTREVSESELDRLLGVPVYTSFSAAIRELHIACLKRRLPAKTSEFCVEMAGLARKLAGLPPEKPRSIVSQIFSFAEKRSVVAEHASSVGKL